MGLHMQALSYLTASTLEQFVGPMHVLLARMEAQLAENPELLTDQGRDRMFTSASGSLSRINKLLANALSVQEPDKQACAWMHLHQHGHMLGSRF